LRRKPDVYRIATTTVYRTANAKNNAEVREPNRSRRNPKPNVPQSLMIATKITHKRSTAHRSIALRADAHHTTITRTKDFTVVVTIGYESEKDRTGDEECEKIH
jgi:hypothetical protein